MNNEQILNNLKENLTKDTTFYKFNRIDINEGETSIYFKSKPLYQFGLGTTILYGEDKYPFSISDIAYEENGKLFHILTNKEVIVLKEGFNEIIEDTIVAAATIRNASKEYIDFYVNCITMNDNWKEFTIKEKSKRRK